MEKRRKESKRERNEKYISERERKKERLSMKRLECDENSQSRLLEG